VSVRVYNSAALLADTTVQTAAPCSSLRLADPAGRLINHANGYLLGGLRHCQNQNSYGADTNDSARIYSYRHPNCDYVDVLVTIGQDISESWSLSVTAGDGAAQTISLTALYDLGTAIMIRAPWGASSTGAHPITVTWTSLNIRSIAIWDVPRETLGSGDGQISSYDPSYPAIGTTIERVIAPSTVAGPLGMVQETINAWTNYRRQLMSWWTTTSTTATITAGSYTDFFGGVGFRVRDRQKRSSDTTRDSTWYVWSWCSVGVDEYSIRISSGSDNVVTTRTNTTAAWSTAMSGLAVSCVSDDSITIEGKINSGSGTVYLGAVSGIGGS